MICAKGLGLTNIPIVVININGYYDSFLQMMERCYNETLMKLPPKDLLLVVSNSLDAIIYIENYNREKPLKLLGLKDLENKKKIVRTSSIIALPPGISIWGRSISFLNRVVSSFVSEDDYYSCQDEEENLNGMTLSAWKFFIVGFGVGVTASKLLFSRR